MSGRQLMAIAALTLWSCTSLAQHTMVDEMQMNDAAHVGKVMIDQLEWRAPSTAVWQAQAWYGGDYDKLWVKSEGARAHGITEDARLELAWDRIISSWWSMQAGVREDLGQGPSRTWVSIGIEGLAPQFLAIEATLYLGDGGRSAARFKVGYDLLLTQRLILQPEIEANVYAKRDDARGIDSGVSQIDAALRLRYEIRRRFAPYVGLAWSRQRSASEAHFVAGLHLWF